jgi:hypothetical protein
VNLINAEHLAETKSIKQNSTSPSLRDERLAEAAGKRNQRLFEAKFVFDLAVLPLRSAIERYNEVVGM